MPTLIGILVGLASSLPGRVLTALGIGWVSYVGLDLILGQVQSSIQAAWGQMPSEVLSLLSLAGFNQAFGIILGAYAARVSLMSLARLGKVAS